MISPAEHCVRPFLFERTRLLLRTTGLAIRFDPVTGAMTPSAPLRLDLCSSLLRMVRSARHSIAMRTLIRGCRRGAGNLPKVDTRSRLGTRAGPAWVSPRGDPGLRLPACLQPRAGAAAQSGMRRALDSYFGAHHWRMTFPIGAGTRNVWHSSSSKR